jgi:UDP-glucose 4-epimerase
LVAEGILETELRESETDFAIARFANVFGPRQDAAGEGGVVSVFCEALASDGPLVIHGDGEATRDFVYVSDVVGALTSMIGGDIYFCQRADVPAAGVYNISTGVPVSINNLANALKRVSGIFRTFDYDAPREGDIHDSLLSASKAKEVFEWEPAMPFETALTNTYKWFSRHRSE